MDVSVIVFRLVLSAFLGGLVGIERELKGRTAGFRTLILVCMGSALFMITSILISYKYSQSGTIDPSRIASGVVTGIGFLGAGAVMRFGSSVQGLTTAATIWVVSAIGLAVGMGLYMAASVTTVIVLVVLLLSRLERVLELKDNAEEKLD